MSENIALKRIKRTIGGSDQVSIGGVRSKALILLSIMVAAVLIYPYLALGKLAMLGIFITSFSVALVIIFKQDTAPYLAPIYAALQGLIVSVVSSTVEQQYPGVAVSSMVVTVLLFALVLFLYKGRVIKPSERMGLYVCGALVGILALRVVDVAMGGTLIPLSGVLGIGIQATIVVIAAVSFVIDFREVEKAVEEGLDKRYEWYLAFSLLLGIVWLYLEMLRLHRVIKD